MGLNNTTIKVDSKQVDRILESITGDLEQIDPQVYTESLSQDESTEQKITVTDLSKDSTGEDTVTVIPIQDEQDVESNDYRDTQVLPSIQTGGKEQQYQYISNERIEDNNTDFIEQGFDPKAKTYQEVEEEVVGEEVDNTSKEMKSSEVSDAVNTQNNKEPSKNSIEKAGKFTNNDGLVDKQLLENIENTIAEGLKDDAIDKAVENIDAALKNQKQCTPTQKSNKLKIEGKHFHLSRTSCKTEKENDPTYDQNSPAAVITNVVETTTNTQWVDNSNTDAVTQQNLQRNGGNNMQTQTIKGNSTKLQTNNRIKNTAKALGKTQPKNQNSTATIADYTNNHVQGSVTTDTQTTGKLRQQLQAKQDNSGKQDNDEDLKEFSSNFARQSNAVESDTNLDEVTTPNDTYKALDVSVLNATREQLVNIDDNLSTDVNFTPSKFVAEIQQGMSEEDTFAPINALFNSEGLTVFTKYREQVMTYNLCTKLYDNLKSTGQRYIYTTVNYKDIIQLPKNIDFLGEVDIEDTHYYIFAFIDIPNCFNQTIRKPLLDIIDLILEAIKTLQYSVAQDVEVPLTSQYGVPILTNAEIKGIITSLNNYHVNVSVDDCYTLTIRL